MTFEDVLRLDKTRALNSAIEANAELGFRAEDLDTEDYRDYFVDPIGDTLLLATNTNQIIFGRRGTGKTILVRTVCDYVQRGLKGDRVIALPYDAQDFRASPQFTSSKPNVRQEATAYFNTFITKLAGDLSREGQRILFEERNWLDNISPEGRESRARRMALLETIVEIEEVARYGIQATNPDDVTQHNAATEEREQKDRSATSLDFRSRFAGKLGEDSLNVNADLGGSANMSRSKASKTGKTKKREESFSRRFSAGRLRDLITKAIDLLGLQYIIIVIDEWITLAECQVEFAQRIKQTLCGSGRIGILLAADQFQCSFSNGANEGQFRGLEIGADIFVSGDLDRPFRDPIGGHELLLQVLYRRLLKCEPALLSHFGPAPLEGENRRAFRESLFSTEQAFRELCRASNGLCRDFLVLFKMCTSRHNYAVTRAARLTTEDVRAAALENFENYSQSALEGADARLIVLTLIVPHLRNTLAPYFFVSRASGGLSHPVIRDLLAKRYIHVIDPSRIHASLRADYVALELEYGWHMSLLRSIAYGDKPKDVSATPIEQISLDKAWTFILSMDSIQQHGFSEFFSCPSCHFTFSVREPLYRIRGICPHCLHDIEPREDYDQ